MDTPFRLSAQMRTLEWVNAGLIDEAKINEVEAASISRKPFHRRGGSVKKDLQCAMHCSCKNSRCVKVIAFDTARNALQRKSDPLVCPAHQKDCHTWSELIVIFYTIVEDSSYKGIIVWDHHDIPGHPRMHFDATLFVESKLVAGVVVGKRFEIDGKSHLSKYGGTRLPQDIIKDKAMNALGADTLRLHQKDIGGWGDCIANHLVMHKRSTSYTNFYHATIREEAAMHNY